MSPGSKPGAIIRRTLNHVALAVADRERSAGPYEAAGVEEVEWQDDGGIVRVQVVGPDGYRVELFAFGA